MGIGETSLTEIEEMQLKYLKSLANQYPNIAAASILAKVTRDDIMEAMAVEYPQYGFEIHKGYGTKAHYEALRTYGPSPIHRMTFLKKFYGEK